MARRHGTRSCYVGGCRRPECIQANRDYENRRQRETRVRYRAQNPRPQIREMTELEVAWLAGLLEGEGAFLMYWPPPGPGGKQYLRLRVQLQMTDRDVVERVHQLVGLGSFYKAKREKPHWKDTYGWTLSARQPVVALLWLLLPHMGERRQQRIRECLAAAAKVEINLRERLSQLEHGLAKYQYGGCRCEVCYNAKAVANAKRYQ